MAMFKVTKAENPPIPPRILDADEGERWLRTWNSARLTRGSEVIATPWANSGQADRFEAARRMLFCRRLVALGKIEP